MSDYGIPTIDHTDARRRVVVRIGNGRTLYWLEPTTDAGRVSLQSMASGKTTTRAADAVNFTLTDAQREPFAMAAERVLIRENRDARSKRLRVVSDASALILQRKPFHTGNGNIRGRVLAVEPSPSPGADARVLITRSGTRDVPRVYVRDTAGVLSVSTGDLPGPAVSMLMLDMLRHFDALHPRGMYVVYSYATPIAWGSMDPGTLLTVPDLSYSRSTNSHQSECRMSRVYFGNGLPGPLPRDVGYWDDSVRYVSIGKRVPVPGVESREPRLSKSRARRAAGEAVGAGNAYAGSWQSRNYSGERNTWNATATPEPVTRGPVPDIGPATATLIQY